MGKINDVIISITRATKRIQEAGFGLPLLLGEGGSHYRLDIDSSESGLRWISKTRGVDYINVVYTTVTQVPTSGSHKWGFTGATVIGDASGLANDGTVYTATIAVDGGAAQPIAITGSASQTMSTVIDEINTDLTGATAAFESSGNGFIKITSATTGDASTVRIVDTDLFSTLTNANTTYETAVDGTDDITSAGVVRTGAGTSGSPYIITVTLDTDETDTIVSTAKEIKVLADADTNTSAIVQCLLQGSTGSGTQSAATVASLAVPSDEYMEFSSVADATYEGWVSGEDIYDMTSATFAQSPAPSLVAIYPRATGAAINTALDTLRLTHDDWYALAINDRAQAAIIIAAAYVDANKKLGVFCTSDETTLDNVSEDRAAIIVHDVPADYPDCAWLGLCLPKDPGSITWKWKKPSGQTAQAYTTTKLNAIAAANGNWLESFGGVIVFKEGITSGGEFIDVMRGMDWVETRMVTEINTLLMNTDKIAMDNEGIPRIEAAVRSVLREASQNGLIAVAETEAEKEKSDDNQFMYVVTAPLRSEISSSDRTARNLTGIEWEYTLAGAVHKVDPVQGRIVA